MQTRTLTRNALGCMAFTALLVAGCGGGGSSSTPTPPPTSVSETLTGLAATGAGIANAAVTARCAVGPAVTGTTDAGGNYTLSLGASATPCMVQVVGGTTPVTLFSFAQTAGRVNITPATDMVVTRALGADPSVQFATFNTAMGATITSNLAAAKTYVSKQFGDIAGTALTLDPITGVFAVGDAHDKVLDAFGATVAAAGKAIGDLRSGAVGNSDLLAVIFPPLAAPANPTATANSTSQITLSWTAVPRATGYQVFKATTAGAVNVAGTAAGTTTDTTFVDTGLTASTAYFYKVVAINPKSTGANATAEFTATTSAATTGAGFTCDTSKFAAGAPVVAPTAAQVSSFAKTYTGSEGSYDNAFLFTASGSATLVFNANGTATYNGASYAPASYCLETLSGGAGTQLVIHSGATSHFDLKSSGAWSGYTTAGKVVTNAAYTGGGGAGGGLVPGLNPTRGAMGSTVTIIGSGFGSNPQVKFYDELLIAGTLIKTETAATVVSSNATQIVVTVPEGANSGPVTVNGAVIGTFTVELLKVGSWTQQESQGGYSLATNGSNFVKVWSMSNVKQSVNGASWNDSFTFASLNYSGGQVQWDGSQFVYMVSKDATSSPVQTIAVSTNGTNWVTKVAGQKLISWDPQYASSLRDFAAVPGRMTLVGDKGGIATSTDGGTNWTLENYPVGYKDNQILAIDDTGSQRIALTLFSDGAAALRSNSGGAWSAVATGLDLTPADLIWTGSMHVATGAAKPSVVGARVLRSSDGQTWTAANLPAPYTDGTWKGVKLEKHGGVLWLLLHKQSGLSPTGGALLRSSDDGLNWILDTDFGNDPVSALAFGTNLWIAIGNKTYTRTAP